MPLLGATIAILQANRVLLTKREDFEVWCLPGGHVDPGESVAQAAVREAREETGLESELQRLVGVYSRTGSGDDVHGVLFAARPVGGELAPQAGEVIDIGYFAAEDLPADMFWWHRQQIADALAGVGGSVAWELRINPASAVQSRRELYDLRDHSGLTRTEFYRYFFETGGTDQANREVGPLNL
jgi:ADP-ribose pyrophosphatase YjhB (NUDIX family)